MIRSSTKATLSVTATTFWLLLAVIIFDGRVNSGLGTWMTAIVIVWLTALLANPPTRLILSRSNGRNEA